MSAPRRALAPAVRAGARLAVALLAVAALSCSAPKHGAKAPSAAIPAKKTVTIGFSLDSLTVERWQRDRDVFVATANSLGAEVIFLNAASGPAQQVNQVNSLIERGVDVLVIIPQDANLFADTVVRAHAKGIKVISYDRLIRKAGVDLYASVDSREVGVLMAQAIIREAPTGNYLFVNGPKSDYNVTLVQEGQRSVLVDYPGVYRILDFYADDWGYDLAYAEVSSVLESGRRVDAIVCGNDGLAGGAIRALAEHRLAGKVPVVGQDADISACQYIVEGSQLMTVYKPISRLARDAATFAVAMADGTYVPPTDAIDDGDGPVPAYWLSPVAVTKANVDEVIIESGFHTAAEVYHNVPFAKWPEAYR
jgi:D-xylose transport system substrate-binding protein